MAGRRLPPSARALRDRLEHLGLAPGEVARLLRALPEAQRRTFGRDWEVWAHEGQLLPAGDWRTWVIMAGRGFGKTRAGAEWVRQIVCAIPAARIALVAATLEEARRIMIDGPSGLLAVAGPEIAEFNASRHLLRFTNGAEATLFSGASPESLRGPEHHAAWCDELAKWKRPGATWDMLQMGLRLGDHPRALVTTTPRPGATLARIIATAGTVLTGGPTRANPHLPEAFVEAVSEQYAGTRLGRQELDGELLTDVEGALWTVDLLERCRLNQGHDAGARPERSAERAVEGRGNDAPEQRPSTTAFGLRSGRARKAAQPEPARPERSAEHEVEGRVHGRWSRIVIGVDPPASTGTCGIVACARDANGIAHVLADHSVTGRPPEAWARAVAAAAEVHRADRIVAERNQGGEMVRAVLRAADARLPIRLVYAAQGKSARAEPVHALFEAGKVVLHGGFPELEAELRGIIAGGGYEPIAWIGPGGPGTSPDRADAMVWALTELMLGDRGGEPRVLGL